jgi:hypothetical protein
MQDHEFAVSTWSRAGARGRYRRGEQETWDLITAEQIADELLGRLSRVSVSNHDHEFWRWANLDSAPLGDDRNFAYPERRWAPWYVDVHIGDSARWRYRPLATLNNYDDAAALAAEAARIPEVTRVIFGASDDSEEFEHETREG